MIEYYTLMHDGGQGEYRDNIFLNFSKTLTMLLLFSSKDDAFDIAHSISINGLISSCTSMTMEELCEEFHKEITPSCAYLLLRIDDQHINLERRGGVYAKIIKRGEVINLSNGFHSLEDGDQICCGTSEFFKYVSDPAVMADAMTSISSEEWMDYMCTRISDANQFEGENLSAVTMIVRED